ncbi:MAG: ribonuclease PH [Caldimicrobium sp.]|nr:ribonuclease PH [Caldimicrobium sp.]MCX7613317.1 ribonuclease PH [Caldimicrobium sp.]MDW8183402.1 ribonuclease PH [Caldimicrobium sp.]
MRGEERSKDELRPLRIKVDFLPNPLSSVLIELGKTMVLCTVSLEEKVPSFLKGSGTGWITAEYAFLPAATLERSTREVLTRKGRSLEIQRLIGRVLRAVTDLPKLGERTLWVDCDVLNADGGTRTASVTGSVIALKLAFIKLINRGIIAEDPLMEYAAGVSVGKIGGDFYLDLDYEEDQLAEVDANFFLTESGKIVEIQAGAEKGLFTWEDLSTMKDLAWKGISSLINKQREVLGE